jgi:hydroxymethylpyrimidine pyrophosphatase-like HAD family hydrolase
VKYEVIAVDFDGTIVQEQWPNIGPLIPECVEVLQKYSKRGGKIILWTCREDWAVLFCIEEVVPLFCSKKKD